MGKGQRKSKGSKGGHRAKNKDYKISCKTRKMDVDQIQDMLVKEKEKGVKTSFEVDDDLPGLGQFYCTECARHFTDDATLVLHRRGKLHKRRLKDVAQKQYNQDEADWAAGKTKEVYKPAHGAKGAEAEAKGEMDDL